MPKPPALPALATEAANVDLHTFRLPLPIHVLLADATRVARFARDYWRERIDPAAKIRPGLELVAGSGFTTAITHEIAALHDLLDAARTAHARATQRDTTARAHLVLDDLRAALRWRCDETRIDAAHTKLAMLGLRHREHPDSQDALADALADHLELAASLQGELVAIGALEARQIDDATLLLRSLRDHAHTGRTAAATKLLQQRDRYAALLVARLSLVRAAARYVFRDHDDVLREIASPYETRAATRRLATEARAA
jgi:hypothetical protein